MTPNNGSAYKPQLVWLYTGVLAETLDAATWLETSAELCKLGWNVTLVVAGPAKHQIIDNFELYSIPKGNVYLLRQFLFHFKFLRLIMRRWSDTDIILFHQMSAPWILPLKAVRKFLTKRGPLLIMDTRTVHMDSQQQESYRARIRRLFYSRMNRAANRWADGQTTITKRMAQAVGVPADKLWGCWPSGVTLEPFVTAGARRRWPKENDPIQLIYIGSLHRERNLGQLCQAVVQANQQGCAIHLTLVGAGTAQAELAQFATQYEKWICLLAPVPHKQVPELLANAHVGTLPFPDEEKFRVSSPIKLFEYMASGLPILATRIACHTDVIGDDSYVVWADDACVSGLAAALHKLWERRETLPSMGHAAAVAASSWTWSNAAMQLKLALEHGLQTTKANGAGAAR